MLAVLGLTAAVLSEAAGTGNGPTPSLATLGQMTMFAYTSYCPAGDILNWTCYWCTQNSAAQGEGLFTVSAPDENLFGYVFATPAFVGFAFRGTQATSVTNWIENLDAKHTAYPLCADCEVHNGFYDNYLTLAPQMKANAARLFATPQFAKLPVVVIGHSMGGALATFFAGELAAAYPQKAISSFTFGSPRVGNANYTAWFAGLPLQDVWRTTNFHDIVPHVPPQFLRRQAAASGYMHVTEELWFSTGDNVTLVRCSPDDGEDPACADSVPVYDYSIINHLTYLGLFLGDGKPYGC